MRVNTGLKTGEKTHYRRLMEPGKIGSLTLKNRIVKVGSHPGFYCNFEGGIPQEIIDHYETLASGGVGLIVVGGGLLAYPALNMPYRGFSVAEDKHIPALRKLADAARQYNCPALVQIFTPGPMATDKDNGSRPVSASFIPEKELPLAWMQSPREIQIEEINELKQKYIEAAQRLKDAGFDGIEINAACINLFNSFLSLAWNRRQDIYGMHSYGSRARILTDVIRGIKEQCGREFVISVLINGAEPGLENGLTTEESSAIARLLEIAGADALQIRAEVYNHPQDPVMRDSTHFPDMAVYPDVSLTSYGVKDTHFGRGGWVPMAAAIKKAVGNPVIAVGKLDIKLGEKLLKHHQIDFVGMNRPLIADSRLPQKAAEGKEEDITPCTGCMICYDQLEHGHSPRCMVNATLEREKELAIKPAEKSKNVVVIGAGPAGMEAARVAALRGHRVTLYEKQKKLGGMLNYISVIKGCRQENLLTLVNYYKHQLHELGVEIKLGAAFTPESLKTVKTDVIILASGGVYANPDIPGIEKKIVVSGRTLHEYINRALRYFSAQRLRGLTDIWMPVGKKVIIIGGSRYGCEIAEFLINRGRKVTILDSSNSIGDDLSEVLCKPKMLSWLEENGVNIESGVSYNTITDKGINITTKDGQNMELKANSIITALPLQPDSSMYESFKNKAEEVYKVGDSASPGLIVDAVAAGLKVARAI